MEMEAEELAEEVALKAHKGGKMLPKVLAKEVEPDMLSGKIRAYDNKVRSTVKQSKSSPGQRPDTETLEDHDKLADETNFAAGMIFNTPDETNCSGKKPGASNRPDRVSWHDYWEATDSSSPDIPEGPEVFNMDIEEAGQNTMGSDGESGKQSDKVRELIQQAEEDAHRLMDKELEDFLI